MLQPVPANEVRVGDRTIPEMFDVISEQASMSDMVTLTDVTNHLELIAATGSVSDAYAARGALNAIKVLAELANVDTSMLAVDVTR